MRPGCGCPEGGPHPSSSSSSPLLPPLLLHPFSLLPCLSLFLLSSTAPPPTAVTTTAAASRSPSPLSLQKAGTHLEVRVTSRGEGNGTRSLTPLARRLSLAAAWRRRPALEHGRVLRGVPDSQDPAKGLDILTRLPGKKSFYRRGHRSSSLEPDNLIPALPSLDMPVSLGLIFSFCTMGGEQQLPHRLEKTGPSVGCSTEPGGGCPYLCDELGPPFELGVHYPSDFPAG